MIGPNGAGKTTFFNLISGFFPPTSGTILFDDQDITRAGRRTSASRMGMARTFQITEIFPELSVRENLRIPVEVASGFRLRPWLSRQDDATRSTRASSELMRAWAASRTRPTAWSASCRTATSARPRS